MTAPHTAIPYQTQAGDLGGRACGAACLSMVYSSLGAEVPQSEIWPKIAKENRFGQVSSTTFLMAQDALNRGFRAVAVQARHPLQALRLAKSAGVRVVLNHRVQRESAAGHYTVLVDIDNTHVVLHDPLYGAANKLTYKELLELWLPQVPNSEIVGGMLIAIAPKTSPAIPACEFCHTPIPAIVDCPRCKKPVGLAPGAILGCVKDGCIARMWNWVCCPACDCLFTMKDGAATTATGTVTPPVTVETASPIPTVDIAALFAEMDKFTNHILSFPVAAEHPEIQRQVALIAAEKEKFKVAHAEDVANRTALLAQLSAIREKAKRTQEAAEKQREQEQKSPASLNGTELGNTLLRNLGFKS